MWEVLVYLLLLRLHGSHSGLQTQLELRLRRANESLEDLRAVWVKGDVAASRVGETLEDDDLLGLDV